LRAINEPEVALDLPEAGMTYKRAIQDQPRRWQPVEAAKRKTNHDHQRQLPHCNYAASAAAAAAIIM